MMTTIVVRSVVEPLTFSISPPIVLLGVAAVAAADGALLWAASDPDWEIELDNWGRLGFPDSSTSFEHFGACPQNEFVAVVAPELPEVRAGEVSRLRLGVPPPGCGNAVPLSRAFVPGTRIVVFVFGRPSGWWAFDF